MDFTFIRFNDNWVKIEFEYQGYSLSDIVRHNCCRVALFVISSFVYSSRTFLSADFTGNWHCLDKYLCL